MNLSTAAATDSTVAITRHDGKVFTGQIDDLGEGRYKVVTGLRGRPAILTDADVKEIAAA